MSELQTRSLVQAPVLLGGWQVSVPLTDDKESSSESWVTVGSTKPQTHESGLSPCITQQAFPKRRNAVNERSEIRWLEWRQFVKPAPGQYLWTLVEFSYAHTHIWEGIAFYAWLHPVSSLGPGHHISYIQTLFWARGRIGSPRKNREHWMFKG